MCFVVSYALDDKTYDTSTPHHHPNPKKKKETRTKPFKYSF